MILSKRERYIAIGAGLAIALLIVYYYGVSPLLAAQESLKKQIADKGNERDLELRLIDSRPAMNKKWAKMVGSGLNNPASDVKAQIFKAIGDWADDAKLQLSNL